MRFISTIILLTFIGCYSPKKADKQLNKAYINYPELVAEKSGKWFPCLPIEVKRDSVRYVAFLQRIDTLLEVKRDTILDTIYLDKICPERKILIKYKELLKSVPPIHDTIKIKDMSCETIRGDLTAQNTKLRVSIANHLKWIIGLIIALCISILLHLIRKR
jgi:hypothetical protein